MQYKNPNISNHNSCASYKPFSGIRANGPEQPQNAHTLAQQL